MGKERIPTPALSFSPFFPGGPSPPRATFWNARWANFEYRTFDLAYYVQALWQLIHGRFHVSVLDVPLLGNHVEPIVFLIAPLFLLFRHPLLLVVVQNAALASMGPV